MSYDEHLISMAGGDGDVLDQIQAPLPDDARMDAYYYGFERTGVGSIDAILSAVAIAGKGSHHTESWNEESDYGYYTNRPGLPNATSAVELIQKAAEVAAENATALLAMVREQRAALVALEADVDGELQDAEPSNYEEDNYDAGYIAGLTYAQDKLRAALEPTP